MCPTFTGKEVPLPALSELHPSLEKVGTARHGALLGTGSGRGGKISVKLTAPGPRFLNQGGETIS